MTKSKLALALLAALSANLSSLSASAAPKYPTTAAQSATAQQVAQAGVPLSELAADAPDSYIVKAGDTLWAISSLFLRSPWRWPELWGMNLDDVRNPHLIYPGQKLVLIKLDGRALLQTESTPAAADDAPAVVRLSPRTRVSAYNKPLATLQTSAIEPFLAEPLIVDEETLEGAPRIVATQEGRVLLSPGDRAYVRSSTDAPLLDDPSKTQYFRIFRSAKPLKDPMTGEVLGYEAAFLGKASLARGESVQDTENADGSQTEHPIPAAIDILSAKEEIWTNDRLLPEPPRQFLNFIPHAPAQAVQGRIVSVYGSAVVNASQHQVVAINLGRRDGIETGHVLAILKDGARVKDRTLSSRPTIKLPDERNGLMMVFQTFDKLSYALILDITDGVKVGDRLHTPR